jgi:hypothetical protein
MKKVLFFVMLLLGFALAFACKSQPEPEPEPEIPNQGPNPQWRLIENLPFYFSEDAAVSGFTDNDNDGIDKTGAGDSREGIQTLLNRLGRIGGGALYLSEGRYRINGQLIIPRGVVLRGDWQQPKKDAPVRGTILMAYHGRGSEEEDSSFIIMEPSTGLYNVAIWYPEQLPESIMPYPPSVLYGKKGYWGNDYTNVRNVTLVNSFSGIVLNLDNGGGCPNIFNLYGSPLSRGIEIDNIADVGRFDWIDFSPDYWSASGLPNAPAKNGTHVKYIRENATGMVMRRNDWSYTCHFTVDGYRTGYYAGQSLAVDDRGVRSESTPNGHNYHLTFTNCTEAIRIDAVANVGKMFTHVRISDCDNGIVVGSSIGGTTQFLDCEIAARQDAINIAEMSSIKFMSQQCKVQAGRVNISGGLYVSVDGDFNNPRPQVSINAGGRALLSGNRFAQEADIRDNSLFQSVISHTPVNIKPMPDFPELKPRVTAPARNALYVVTDPEFGGLANYTFRGNWQRSLNEYNPAGPFGVVNASFDNTAAIQNALNKAGTEGGGIVFLPPGKYRVNGNLVIPTGVELKGASDLASVPKGQGSIIEVYAGKNKPNGQPFIKLSERSGIRGITFNYPEITSTQVLRPASMPKYPYCLQAAGADVYIVNVSVIAMYQGIDLFTYKCDNHYVDYFAGHVFKNAMTIGGGSANGLISNTQFNSLVFSNGHEWKFGTWPNSINNAAARKAVYDQNFAELEFMVLKDCSDQLLYNNFHYASHIGIFFGRDNTYPSGISMGLGLDASMRSVYIDGIDPNKGFDLINSQVVSVATDVYNETKFIETSPRFTGEAYFYSSDYWGNARYGVYAGGGTINFYLAHFDQYGTQTFLEIPSDAAVNLVSSDVNAVNFNTPDKNRQVSVKSSVIAASSPAGYRSFAGNITFAAGMNQEMTLPRTGWLASASNGTARLALDGDGSTRWTAGMQARSGQWFSVDTRQAVTFNAVILDTSLSPNDWPSSYEVYAFNTADDRGTLIASGSQPSSLLIIRVPETTARYVTVARTGGNKSNYWSIHEFYLANIK